jgi:hypothetical protein
MDPQLILVAIVSGVVSGTFGCVIGVIGARGSARSARISAEASLLKTVSDSNSALQLLLEKKDERHERVITEFAVIIDELKQERLSFIAKIKDLETQIKGLVANVTENRTHIIALEADYIECEAILHEIEYGVAMVIKQPLTINEIPIVKGE